VSPGVPFPLPHVSRLTSNSAQLLYNSSMDNKEKKKKSFTTGQREEKQEKGGCIILRKGEVLSLKVIENDLKECEKKEKIELSDLFRHTKGGQGNEEF